MNPAPEITITVSDVLPNHDGDDSDYARWKTEQSPCFPRPLCVALPPKRPDRQASVANTSNHSTDKQATPPKKAPPKIPRRRVSRVNKLTMGALSPRRRNKLTEHSPPQRPIRQKSAGGLLPHLPFLDGCERFPSGHSALTEDSDEEDSSSSDEESFSGDEEFLSDQLEGGLRLEGSIGQLQHHDSTGSSRDQAMESSVQDISPSRPTRQRTVFEGFPTVPALASSGSETGSEAAFAKTSPTDDSDQPEWVKLWESQGEGKAADFSKLWSCAGDN